MFDVPKCDVFSSQEIIPERQPVLILLIGAEATARFQWKSTPFPKHVVSVLGLKSI